MSGYRKYLTDEEYEVFRNWEMDPNTPSSKDIMYHFYRLMGMDVEYEEVLNIEDI